MISAFEGIIVTTMAEMPMDEGDDCDGAIILRTKHTEDQI